MPGRANVGDHWREVGGEALGIGWDGGRSVDAANSALPQNECSVYVLNLIHGRGQGLRMRVRDLEGLRQALHAVGAQKVGMGPTGSPVASALNIPGQTFWQRYGIPPPIIAAFDALFEGLPWPEARAAAIELPVAVARAGRDLRPVPWQFLAAELRVMADHHTERLHTALFVRRLAAEIGQGLASAAEGTPWTEAVYVLDQLPRQTAPVAGWTTAELAASLDFDTRRAMRQAIKARLNADIATVATIRLQTVARDLPSVRAALGRAIDEVCRSVQEFQRAIVATGAFAAALAAPSGEECAAVTDLAKLIGYRRQATTLLHLIRSQ